MSLFSSPSPHHHNHYHPIISTFTMIVDPMQAMASVTSALATSSSVAPIPTVIPSLPEYQDISEVGTRTLW